MAATHAREACLTISVSACSVVHPGRRCRSPPVRWFTVLLLVVRPWELPVDVPDPAPAVAH
jgi:hypothetical protein